MARLSFVPGLIGCLVRALALFWAYGRTYHDNQRNWALLIGWRAVVGGELLILIAAFLRPRRT